MKILLIQTAFIGDVVLATALVEKLKEKNPDCSIDFLLRKGNESLLSGHPHIRKVLVFDKKKQKIRNLFRLIRAVRAESYEYVINLQRFFSTGLITALSGAKVKIGFDKNPLSFLFTHSVRHLIGGKGQAVHEVRRNLSLIQPILGETEFVRPRLYPSESDYRTVATEGEYICIAPASIWFTKQFPAKGWIELIQKVPPQYKIFLMGGPGDLNLCESIRGQCGRSEIEVMAGKLSFLQSAALISGAKMNFVNDSAPLHFASAMNAPVTAIFCSTLPEFGFGPLSETSFTVESEEKLECRPCNLHGKNECPMKHFKCADIGVEKILKTANLI